MSPSANHMYLLLIHIGSGRAQDNLILLGIIHSSLAASLTYHSKKTKMTKENQRLLKMKNGQPLIVFRNFTLCFVLLLIPDRHNIEASFRIDVLT